MTDSTRPKPFVVLGIDPGTRVVGYGAIVDGARGPRLLAAGVVRAPDVADVPARLGHIRRELDDLIAKLRPAVVVVEQAFTSKNMQSALRIGEGRGVVLACASGAGAQIVQLTPAVAKKALVGHGAADKRQVARMVLHALSLTELDLPLDASDALALALAHLLRRHVVAPKSARRKLPDAITRALDAADRSAPRASAARSAPCASAARSAPRASAARSAPRASADRVVGAPTRRRLRA